MSQVQKVPNLYIQFQYVIINVLLTSYLSFFRRENINFTLDDMIHTLGNTPR